MKCAPEIANTERPSVCLRILAAAEATPLGHQLGRWTEKANGAHTAVCLSCGRVASVIPALLTRDGRGRGGRALRERCGEGARNELNRALVEPRGQEAFR